MDSSTKQNFLVKGHTKSQRNNVKSQYRISIEEFLQDILIKNNISDLFECNELAYITLQQKNERQVRDKVAWKLQKRLDYRFGVGTFMVRCEWPSIYDEHNLDYQSAKGIVYAENKCDEVPCKKECTLNGRKAVDIAVLLMSDDRKDYKEVIALIEFKSHLFLNKDGWVKKEFPKDVYKMRAFTQLSRVNNPQDKRIKNADLYFVYIMNSHERSDIDEYASAVAYKDTLDLHRKNSTSNQTTPILCSDVNYQPKLDGEFNDIIKSISTKTKVNTYQRSNINLLGSSFIHPLFCTCMVWGPYKGQDLV